MSSHFSLPPYLSFTHADIRVMSTSLPNCSTQPVANASSVKRLLDARARFRIANVASSDMESAWLKQFAYSDSVLAWKPGRRLDLMGLLFHVNNIGWDGMS